jgi:hypothetical protein
LEATDARIRIVRGRIEPRFEPNPLADEIRAWLDTAPAGVDEEAARTLRAMALAKTQVKIPREKAVDVSLAVELIRFECGGEFDRAGVERVNRLLQRQREFYASSAWRDCVPFVSHCGFDASESRKKCKRRSRVKLLLYISL